MHFDSSGIETYWWITIVVPFVISILTSTAGISGAFLLLPFQVSFLGFTGPSVSATNLVYNIFATPGGILRYFREKRLVWPLVLIISLGTLPGVILGIYLRVRFLPDPRSFKFFVGLVLLYIAIRLIQSIFNEEKGRRKTNHRSDLEIKKSCLTWKQVSFIYDDTCYSVGTFWLFLLSLMVGVIGGTYGIGGGSIVSPFLISIFGLPVYAVAGATLFGTFLTSIYGVIFYTLLAPIFAQGLAASPDWKLGIMLSIGGLAGTFTGAVLQRYLPTRLIVGVLIGCILFVSGKYIYGFFF
ncbi:sulfite exporter TauE/SafE family protein [bacterium]|nr:sulfite exporter TauE/SafE family protein [bacterium]